MDKLIDINLPIFISADNQTIKNIIPVNQVSFDLQELYKLIVTDIVQVVELYDNTIMILDEEGKLKDGRIVNQLATQLYSVDRMDEAEWNNLLSYYESIGFGVVRNSDSTLGLPHNSIVGNVVICQSKYFE